ncbi:tyrosinase family protein [Vulcaniibacterium tengchongense]|uniref:Polyphenol oxidase-like protein n=1 Tax=Vulcaniibacterium tengchongense TaxID=1273429 RepID=A0A3N4VIU7_9GAMM|nr:tyrosinase family protein [Vulcaniibacterium tengchongense]RPE81613.1 polyphenol oxidase-like protein [Vulcaniibacterium tengchongense]
MPSLSRRRFLYGLAASPLLLHLPSLNAQAAPLIRYDASSAAGQAMLRILAGAVAQMQARPADDPLSWTWQWYTHFVDGTTTKADEIARIFGGVASPRSVLAEEVWNTCQSHAGQNPNHFLPWHRLFVQFFEQIVRTVSGRPDFTLPYWNYTSYEPTKRGIVPHRFRQPTDATFSVLYRADRTTLANTGQPIHRDQPGDAMDISLPMSKANYSSAGSVMGFCRTIDSGIHSRIHVLVGNSLNMGSVPYAGRDPLFWVHHANVDRMWASWNRNGGVNPSTATWAQTEFVFADGNGDRVVCKLVDCFDIATLGYTYDKFLTPTGTEVAATAATMSAATAAAEGIRAGTPVRVAAARAAAELGGAGPVRVALLPEAGARRTQVLGLDPVAPEKRTYLVLKNLHTWAQPEVLYHLYLTPGRGGAAGPATYVGNINFFDAEFHDHGHGSPLDEALGENFYSFDVTELLRKFARAGGTAARDSLTLTIVPGGRPKGGQPIVATIELVQQ